MKVTQLEQLYRDGMSRLKEQKKRQEQGLLEQTVKRLSQEQKALYEKKLQDIEQAHAEELKKIETDSENELRDTEEARRRELRLVQEELERITDQAVSLRRHVEELLVQKKE